LNTALNKTIILKEETTKLSANINSGTAILPVDCPK
jgi:hypothetical protein